MSKQHELAKAARALVEALPKCELCGEIATHGRMAASEPGYCDEPDDPAWFVVRCKKHGRPAGHNELPYTAPLLALIAALD